MWKNKISTAGSNLISTIYNKPKTKKSCELQVAFFELDIYE